MMGWLTQPGSGTGTVGVAIVPPLGYEYWTSHRALRTLAERLASQGCSVLRFDLDGTADSAGGPADPDRLAAWQASVGVATGFLRGIGSMSVVVVGVRIGGTLALLEGEAAGAERVVAWAPVARGKSYVRELQLLSTPIPEGSGLADLDGGIAHAGSAFSRETLADLRAIDLTTLVAAPAPRILVVDRDDRPTSDALIERLRSLGVTPDHLVLSGTAVALDRPVEYADVPDQVVQAICTWVGPSTPSEDAVDPETVGRTMWRDRDITEEVVRLGPGRLVGIDTEPTLPRRATIVWVNSGSEPHVGPGRAWVEFARALGAAGYASVRLDFSGWGESPDDGHAPGRPYDAHCVDEVVATVDALRERGHRQIVVAGLCAGAWVGLRTALTGRLDGVIAINPQLYWQPGDPVEADLVTETRVRRQGEIRRIAWIRRTGLWSVLDALGIRHPAAVWLRRLDSSGCPVLTVFADGDDGIEFLESRVGRTWARVLRRGTITSTEIPDIDHPMHRTWRRGTVVDELRRWLDALPPAGAADVTHR